MQGCGGLAPLVLDAGLQPAGGEGTLPCSCSSRRWGSASQTESMELNLPNFEI